MSATFFDELMIPAPRHHLGVSGGGHGRMTGRMMEQIEPVLADEKPDLVLIYGDTNTTLAAAARISGVTPAALTALLTFVRRREKKTA